MNEAAGQRVPAHARELSGVTGLFHFGRDPLAAFAGAAQRHGDIVEFSQLRGSYLLLSHPQAIEAVLHHRGPEFEKDFFTRDLGAILGQGLLNAEGERWRKKRKLMAPTFQPRELGMFSQTMVSSTDELVAALTSGELRDVHADAMHLTLDIVARTLFGARVERFAEVEHALAVVATEHRLLWQTWRALLPRWAPLPSHRRLRAARASLDSVLLEVIEHKRRTPGKDLLSELIALTDDEGQAMSNEELRDEAMTLFLAGHETTALGLTYTLHLLATHPDVYERMTLEIARVLAGRAPTQADLEQLPFTAAVVREGLRLYPPVWTVARLAMADVEVAGIAIPARTQVMMSQWVVQRDARWFPEPERFHPERWLAGEATAAPRFAYFPFGGGPRVCIGQHFALLELVLVLARLTQAVRFEAVPGEALALAPVATLRPRGSVRLRVHCKEGRLSPAPEYHAGVEARHA